MREDLKRLKAFFLLFRPHWFSYGLSSILVACRNLFISWLTAFISSQVMAVVTGTGQTGLLQELALFLILLAAFSAFDSVGIYAQRLSIQKIGNLLRQTLCKRVLETPLAETGRFGQRGELISRVNQDVEMASGLLSYGLLTPVMYLISGIGATILIGRESLLLCLGLYLLGAAGLFVHTKAAKAARSAFSAMQKDTAEELSAYLQTLSRSADIRMSALSGSVSASFEAKLEDYRRHGRRYSLFQGLTGGFSQVVQYVGFFGTIGFSLFLCARGEMTLSDVVMVSQMASLILTMVLTIFSSITSVHNALVGIDRIFEALSLPAENREGSTFSPERKGVPLLQAEGVGCTFSDGICPFSALSLIVPAGGITAVRGESGAGKSTLMRLLLKFYPYSGSLRLLGQEVSGCSAPFLRRAISYVPQENLVFSGTLRENLLLGVPETDMDEKKIRQVLEGIGADRWVYALEKGLDTPLAEGGSNLSGGQRQMLAIARAILSGRSILILDEAFAGVDSTHIPRILSYLKALPSRPSVLLVTHDESAAALCDRQVTVR